MIDCRKSIDLSMSHARVKFLKNLEIRCVWVYKFLNILLDQGFKLMMFAAEHPKDLISFASE